MNYKTIIGGCGVGLLLAAAAMGESKTEPALLAWTAEKEFTKQLADETGVGSFGIRPPRGFERLAPEGPEGMQTFAWKGAERADGSSPYVMVLLITAPPGETDMPPLELVLKKHLAGVERRRDDWKQATAETGTVNGIPFMRAHWSGTDKATGRKMHGFIYVAVSGSHIVQISSQDIEPHVGQALKLTEASVLSFREKRSK